MDYRLMNGFGQIMAVLGGLERTVVEKVICICLYTF